MHTVLKYQENDAIDWISAEAILSFPNLFSAHHPRLDAGSTQAQLYAALLIHCQCFPNIGSDAGWLEAVCARLVIARVCSVQCASFDAVADWLR